MPSRLSLSDIRRIAETVAKTQTPPLDVVGARHSQEGTSYTEVLLTIRGCRTEPCRVLVGVAGHMSEPECRRVIEAKLNEHLADHKP
jgi:hypothetical protein